jgi:hypothetical protein
MNIQTRLLLSLTLQIKQFNVKVQKTEAISIDQHHLISTYLFNVLCNCDFAYKIVVYE